MTHPLIKFRESEGLSQLELGKLIGVSQAKVSKVEQGQLHLKRPEADEWERRLKGRVTAFQLIFPDRQEPRRASAA